MSILITGATGDLGSKVIHKLLEKVPADQLAVSVRDVKKAEHLKEQGVDVRHGDFDHPDTLDTAFSGVEKLLIISTDGGTEERIRQHAAAVDAAKKAGVKSIAYTSLVNAQKSDLVLAEVHKATELKIQDSGIPYTFLRNNWYLENEAQSIQAAIQGAPWITSAGEGKIGWALKEDYAAAAAEVLATEGHENKIYELSGETLTQKDLVSALEKLLNKTISIQYIDDEAYYASLKDAGLPEPAIPFVVDIQKGIREGALDVPSTDFEKLLGSPITPLDTGLKKIIDSLE